MMKNKWKEKYQQITEAIEISDFSIEYLCDKVKELKRQLKNEKEEREKLQKVLVDFKKWLDSGAIGRIIDRYLSSKERKKT